MSKNLFPVREPQTEVIHIRCSKQDKYILQMEANRRNIKLSQLVKEAIKYYLENYQDNLFLNNLYHILHYTYILKYRVIIQPYHFKKIIEYYLIFPYEIK